MQLWSTRTTTFVYNYNIYLHTGSDFYDNFFCKIIKVSAGQCKYLIATFFELVNDECNTFMIESQKSKFANI